MLIYLLWLLIYLPIADMALFMSFTKQVHKQICIAY